MKPCLTFFYCFVVGVLRNQLATHGKVEDGLPQLLDVRRTGGDAREVVQEKRNTLPVRHSGRDCRNPVAMEGNAGVKA